MNKFLKSSTSCTQPESDYYVYIYLKDDGTPYYVGKGRDYRYHGPHGVEVPPRERIHFLFEGLTDEWARFKEMEFIDMWGRLDDGTGFLENCTDGGDAPMGRPCSDYAKQRASETHKGKIVSAETRRKQSEAAKRRGANWTGPTGKPSWNKGKKHTEEHRANLRKAWERRRSKNPDK